VDFSCVSLTHARESALYPYPRGEPMAKKKAKPAKKAKKKAPKKGKKK